MAGFAPLYDSETGRASAWKASDDAAYVVSQNITTKFREAFETYTPGANWAEVKANGDLVFVDGNSAAASYLVISKNPLVAGTESSITSALYFGFPVEIAFGISMSQRTLGQEFAIEVVDTSDPLPDVSDIQITSISQTTTTLTVDTAVPHGLSVGRSIGVYGCSDQRANYPALVVASTPSPTQFTATAGPGGTIASQTIANPSGAKGLVFFRERLGRAKNGLSQIFENATATNASLYIRAESGDALPSGTIAGNHSAAIGTTAPVALVTAAYQYAWAPTNEYRMLVQADRIQWADSAVDALGQTTSRLLRTQVCPDPSESYKFRVRCTSNKSLTVPNAQIVSAVKTGTTTATITTATDHGFTTGDLVVIYGIRDQAAASFPNLTTATAVTVVDSVTFTIVIGTASTVTSYGGYVAKVQGGNLMSALGAIAQAVQSATLSTLSDGTRQLVLVGSASWAGLSIGDLVQLVGVRDAVAGATLGVDGAWKVANLVTTTLTLVLPFSGSMTIPSDFALINCGGGVIKRTDMRISFVRIFDYERERVEMLARPTGDMSAAAPVVVQNTPAVTVSGTPAVTISSGTVTTVTTVTTLSTLTGGAAAEDAATASNPIIVGGVVRTAQAPTTLIAGDAARATMTSSAAAVVQPYSIPELTWQYAAANNGILNTTTAVTFKAAAAASIRNYVTAIQVMAEALTNATELAVRDGAAGTVLWRIKIPTGGLPSTAFVFPSPLRGSAATLLEVVTLSASGAGAVYFNAQGFTAV